MQHKLAQELAPGDTIIQGGRHWTLAKINHTPNGVVFVLTYGREKDAFLTTPTTQFRVA